MGGGRGNNVLLAPITFRRKDPSLLVHHPEDSMSEDPTNDSHNLVTPYIRRKTLICNLRRRAGKRCIDMRPDALYRVAGTAEKSEGAQRNGSEQQRVLHQVLAVFLIEESFCE